MLPKLEHTDERLTCRAGLILINRFDKGDGQMSHKGIRGYHPLLGACCELGLFVYSRFQFGNASPQSAHVDFIHHCVDASLNIFSTLRVDSAVYNAAVINDCFDNNRFFTITADHDVAETVHTMERTKKSFRIVVKRYVRQNQMDAFDGAYTYLIIATNIPQKEKDTQAIIHRQLFVSHYRDPCTYDHSAFKKAFLR